MFPPFLTLKLLMNLLHCFSRILSLFVTGLTFFCVIESWGGVVVFDTQYFIILVNKHGKFFRSR